MGTRSARLILFAAAALGAGAAGAEAFAVREAAPGVYVGPRPENDAAWSRLRDLGVRTVVGVEGAPPDAAAASALGMRPIHAPMGYGEVAPETLGVLTRVAEESPRPLYVYCHHGRHRGPAAAAIVCRAAGLLDAAGAEALLLASGTAADYVGLWRSVAGFEPPPRHTWPELLSRSTVGPLRLAMTHLDDAWSTIAAAPDNAQREAAIVVAREALRESRRAVSDHADLRRRFREAETLLDAVSARRPEASARFEAACGACHAAHRDAR